MPLLVPAFGVTTSIFLAPWFFGLGKFVTHFLLIFIAFVLILFTLT